MKAEVEETISEAFLSGKIERLYCGFVNFLQCSFKAVRNFVLFLLISRSNSKQSSSFQIECFGNKKFDIFDSKKCFHQKSTRKTFILVLRRFSTMTLLKRKIFAQKENKKAFLGVFGNLSTETFRIFEKFLQVSPTSQDFIQMEVEVIVTNRTKKSILVAQELRFVPKVVERDFFVVFRLHSSQNHCNFTDLFRLCSNSQKKKTS